jgi:hypothetical protein
MTTRADQHKLSFDSGARDILDALYAFEEEDKEEDKKCPPKKKAKRSAEQKAQTRKALSKAREEGGGFDQMSKSEVKAAAKKGGKSPRKKTC